MLRATFFFALELLFFKNAYFSICKSKCIHKTESKQRSTARGTDQARNEFRFLLSFLRLASTWAIFLAATRCSFCRAKVATSKSHV